MNYLYAPISRQTFKRNPPVIAIFSPLFVLVALYQLIIILFPSFSIAIGIKISICFDIFPILPNFPRFSLNIFFLSLSPLLKFCIIKRNWSIYNMVTNHSSVLNGSSAISLPFVIINFNQEKKKFRDYWQNCDSATSRITENFVRISTEEGKKIVRQ